MTAKIAVTGATGRVGHHVARRGDPLRVGGRSDPADPAITLYETGALLPGPDAKLAGPTFEEWIRTSWRLQP
jgi:uncharacterized protein YbjT (DUF2867 family)